MILKRLQCHTRTPLDDIRTTTSLTRTPSDHTKMTTSHSDVVSNDTRATQVVTK
jgi:hypothetical protein